MQQSLDSHLSIIILTRNESLHIARCLSSIKYLPASIFVIDSGSTDDTTAIASSYGASVFFNEWVNYSSQFSYALTLLPKTTKWVLRLDADEYFDHTALKHIRQVVEEDSYHNGFYCSRRIIFLGSALRYGGIGSVKTLRLFRYGNGHIESRWMDEHVCVSGSVGVVKGYLYDHNLRTLSWWIEKHNSYSSREAVDVLLSQSLSANSNISISFNFSSVSIKRLFKSYVYPLIPNTVRSLCFFLFRYFVLLGFLDGYSGLSFHFLQCYWYRFLVDLKVDEVLAYSTKHNVPLTESIRRVLRIDITAFDTDY